ncbi:UNVERIFIED_CONTAM: hypothetical protein GTU68_008445 [Idotea baltica]|nr:hypothetical protein [Idotea baltica]
MTLTIEQKQDVLEISELKERLEHLLVLMESEIELFEVEQRIRGRVKKQMEKSQKEYYLNEQMKAIQKELGEVEEGGNDIEQLETKINEVGMPKFALEKTLSELNKLKMMSPMSAEASVLRGYIDWMVGVPWKKRSRVRHDLERAERILNEDHYGLEEVKERILEFLAVQQRVKKLKGPVLCLVGPPGVGKTSLGESIAKATGRKYVRMSLGGVRDEAEIRGHRRTYIGSLPGKLIQKLAKVEVKNPLFLLDEIDKMGMDHRGDPASAMLEVLDPEQNNSFNDHYLEVDYDLSEVMFICTANSMNIPGPLLDRMEVIRIPGYTEDEKLNIALKYLLPKQRKANGLKKDELDISEEAITDIIRYYTREAGVRGIERELAKVCRKVVTMHVREKQQNSHLIHVPEGATPKDGPSAGVAMCVAVVSVLTNIPVLADVAMTGEITLRGEVLKIGGLKEKLLAARRGGVRKVIIPQENERDLKEIPDNIKAELEIFPVRWIDEVLDLALQRKPEPLSDDEYKQVDPDTSKNGSEAETRINTH